MLDKFRTQKIIWDKANNEIFEKVEANSGDSNGRKLIVQVLNNGMIESLTDCTLSLAWQTKDKAHYGLDAFKAIDIAQGLFEIYYTTGMLSNTGELKASFVLMDSKGRIESKSFEIIVYNSMVDDKAVQSDNSFTALTEALIKVSKYQDQIDDIKEDIINQGNTLISTEQEKLDNLYTEKESKLDTLHQDKLDALNSLHNTEKAELDALEQDYADKATNLETTYAPRLIDVETEIQQARVNADNTVTYSTLKERLDAEHTEVKSQLANKSTYDTVWSMANMGQDVKESMTGGSVAIVGENAVDTINTRDKSINANKIDRTISDLIGIEDLSLNWVIGELQNGNINSLAEIAATTENFITLDKDVYFKFKPNVECEYFIAYYTTSGVFTGIYSEIFTDDTIIPKQNDRKIRVSIRYLDKRLISSVYTLTQYLTVVKEKEVTLKKLDARVQSLEGGNINIIIPTYWKTHLYDKINTIDNLQKNIGYNGTSFGFITDIHWNNNSKNSPNLLKEVMDKCNIPYYFDGGDFTANPSGLTKAQQIEEIKEFKESFSSLEKQVLRTIGNHEDNSINGLYSETIIDTEMYNLVFRQNSEYQKMKNGETGEYYYIDDEMHKIRYITLNCIDIPYIDNGDDTMPYSGMNTWAFRQEQIDWFSDVALNVPNDEWSVVICSHIPINTGYIKNDNIAMNILQAFKDKTNYTGSANIGTDFEVNKSVDYSSKGGNVICWLAGHTHLDSFITLPENITFKEVVTINDSLHIKSGAPTKTIGTTTENAFDVFTINKKTKTVNITRIGAGNDRSFTY